MRVGNGLLLVLFLSLPAGGFSQQKNTLISKLDSLNKKQILPVSRSITSVQMHIMKALNQPSILLYTFGKRPEQEFTKPFPMKRKDAWLYKQTLKKKCSQQTVSFYSK